jgi:opacity protein-like surface antigen
MKRIILIVVLLLTSNLLKAQSVNSFVYDAKGFYINGSILAAAWTLNDIDVDADAGTGIGLKVGYNFNSNFGLYASLDGASVDPEFGDTYALGHFDLGIQGTFGSPANRFKPIVKLALLGMSVQDNDLEVNGSGFGLGGGVLIFLTEKLGLDVNYTMGWIDLTEVVIGSQSIAVDEKASSGRFFIGLSYHF